MTTEPMTAAEATTFEHGISIANATILAQAAVERQCQCTPYRDWYTYRRWQAQGMQVQKGEHGTKIKHGSTTLTKRVRTRLAPRLPLVFVGAK